MKLRPTRLKRQNLEGEEVAETTRQASWERSAFGKWGQKGVLTTPFERERVRGGGGRGSRF